MTQTTQIEARFWKALRSDRTVMLGLAGVDEGHGQPMTAHWGIEDPAAVEGDDAAKRHAVSAAFRLLNRRVLLFTSLPIARLDAMSLKNELDGIGKLRDKNQ